MFVSSLFVTLRARRFGSLSCGEPAATIGSAPLRTAAGTVEVGGGSQAPAKESFRAP
jgi:hypothetical protein